MAKMTASARGTKRKRVTPLRKNMGTKTMQMHSVETNAGTAISCAPCRMASRRSFPSRRLRSMFSISTVASSTRMPTASASPPSVIRFMVLPSALRQMIETRMASGIEIAIIRVLRQLPRKSRIIAACLTAAMILLFLGNWRSTLIIAISIPLAILVSIICLSALGKTMNLMTLGGLALAVGILVDDATVEIENIERNRLLGKDLREAILHGAQEIAVPAFVSTLCICIVFVPMFFLSGVTRFLFVPLAEAVIFAMLASYLLSRTLVPT